MKKLILFATLTVLAAYVNSAEFAIEKIAEPLETIEIYNEIDRESTKSQLDSTRTNAGFLLFGTVGRVSRPGWIIPVSRTYTLNFVNNTRITSINFETELRGTVILTSGGIGNHNVSVTWQSPPFLGYDFGITVMGYWS